MAQRTRTEEVMSVLRREVLEGQYRPGERLPSERDLAARFQTTRGIVRVALKKLEQLGIADVQPGGARVVPVEQASLDVVGHLLALQDPPDPDLVDQVLEVAGALVAASALLLSVVGIYGVMAYTVAQRTHEIGLRMALGAQRKNVMGVVIREGLTLAVAGVGLGLLGTLAVTRVLEGLLFEVTPTDPITIGAVSVLLVTVAGLAAYVPAGKATTVDPMAALRVE